MIFISTYIFKGYKTIFFFVLSNLTKTIHWCAVVLQMGHYCLLLERTSTDSKGWTKLNNCVKSRGTALSILGLNSIQNVWCYPGKTFYLDCLGNCHLIARAYSWFFFFEVPSLACTSITEATIYDCMPILSLSVSFLDIPNYQYQQNCLLKHHMTLWWETFQYSTGLTQTVAFRRLADQHQWLIYKLK